MSPGRKAIEVLHRLKIRTRLAYARVWCQSKLFPPPPKGAFPPVWMAVQRPWGLLAVGGRLTGDSLLDAYSRGIYPLYDQHPVKWYSCNPRMVLFLERTRIEKELRRIIRSGRFRVTFDTAFEEVVQECSNRKWTWLVPERIDVAVALHRRGLAHSVEVWSRDGILVGGAFGVDMGRMFVGESAFSSQKHAMRVALVYLMCHLQHWGYVLNDGQAYGKHLELLGFEQISRKKYVHLLPQLVKSDVERRPWRVDSRMDVSRWIPSKPGSQFADAAFGSFGGAVVSEV